jgi:hypothetical protein
MGITNTTMTRHPATVTVEDMEKHIAHVPGAHAKNLFLRDKKKGAHLIIRAVSLRILTLPSHSFACCSEMFLVSALPSSNTDMKAIQSALGTKDMRSVPRLCPADLPLPVL